MAMATEPVRVTGIAPVRRIVENLKKFLASPKLMKLIVEDVDKRVDKLTASGLDYKGKAFHEYSDGYKTWKKRKYGSSKVNLKASGKMLGAKKGIVHSARTGEIRIESHGTGKRAKTDMLANIHTTGTGKQPQREFMAITDLAINKIVKKRINDPIIKIVGRRRI